MSENELKLYKINYTLYYDDNDDDCDKSVVKVVRLPLKDPEDFDEIQMKIGEVLGQHFPDISINSVDLIK